MASEEDKRRSCVVCGDRATGYHFHALTCEGCKGFFRRTVHKSTGLSCPFAGSCKVNKAQRRHCPACRLRKCLDAGMKKEMILSAEALALRRAKQAQRGARQAAEQLSQEQRALIQTLLGAHSRHMGSMFHQFVLFRVLAPTAPRAPVHPPAALSQPGPRAATAQALCRHQHVHGAASGQVHQGPAHLPVPALGGPDLPPQGSRYRNLSHCTQHHVLPANAALPLWASSLHNRRRSPCGVPERVLRAALWLPRGPEATAAPGARVRTLGRHGSLLARPARGHPEGGD
ncbi:nuclear receptor subfamily 1 group I member 3 isoform 3-T5 [Hipposideros larvatus]